MGEAAALSICTLAAIALAIGGGIRLVRYRDRLRGLLMLAAAIVLLGNVVIWSWPIGR